MDEWLLLSISHSREFALWWKPDERGYTTDLQQAGKYTEERAKFLESRSDSVRAISPETLSRLQCRLVVPVEENFKLLTGKDHK